MRKGESLWIKYHNQWMIRAHLIIKNHSVLEKDLCE